MDGSARNSERKSSAHAEDRSTPRLLDERVLKEIEYLPIECLHGYRNHARTHPKQHLKLLENSVRQFNFVIPVIAGAECEVIAGHARVLVAKKIGLTEVPVIRLHHLTPMQVRALRLADNRLVEIGAWDQEKLATELSDLIEIDFDVSLSGFEAPEAELIIERQFSMVGETTANQIPIPDESQPPISRRGDVFRLGEHRAMCGDAKDANDYKRLLNASVADVVLTDPPYGCKIRHHVSGAGRIKHREFIEASNDMSDQEFTEFLYPAVRNLAAFSTNGSLHYVFIDWRNIYLVEGICRQLYDKHLNTAVWVKNQPSLGSFLRSQHEFCLIYRNGPAPHRNNVQLGRFGRNRSNCWFYEGANSPSPERRAELRLHPTVKSVEMFADILRDSSGRGDLALDPFLGSGTTVIAAEMTQRVCYGLELDPLYLDTIVRRWEAFTGAQAIHDETGLTFQELATARQSSQLLLPPPQASVGEG